MSNEENTNLDNLSYPTMNPAPQELKTAQSRNITIDEWNRIQLRLSLMEDFLSWLLNEYTPAVKNSFDNAQNTMEAAFEAYLASRPFALESYVKAGLATKQDTLSFDSTPTSGSTNPVTSDGVKAALDTKQDALTFDISPIVDSQNPVTSAGVASGLARKANKDETYTKTEVDAALAGKASLEGGKVPASQLPSYVDDVLEYDSMSDFPATGEGAKIYVAKNTNLTYRWSGSDYVNLSSPLALGTTSSSAYRGDWGAQNAQNIANLQSTINTLQAALNALKSSLIEESNSLPTATASSPDFVQVGETLYRKVTTTEGNQTTYAYESIIDDVPIQSGTGDKSLIQKIAGDTDHVASGSQSISLQGKAKATAPNAIAAGYRAEATGENAVALGGYKAKANGENAFATGKETLADAKGTFVSGDYSKALANYGNAHGYYAEVAAGALYGNAFGCGAKVTNPGECAFGKYNDCDTSNTARIFSVGNGTGGNSRHSAFEVGGAIGSEYMKLGGFTVTRDTLEYISEQAELLKLEFIPIGTNQSALVSIGTCTLQHIKIPSTDPDGRTVILISGGINWNSAEVIDCPNTIVSVALGAFLNAPRLRAVRFALNDSIAFEHTSGELVHIQDYIPSGVWVQSPGYNNDPDMVSFLGDADVFSQVHTVSTEAQLAALGSLPQDEAIVLRKDLTLSSSWQGLGTAANPFCGSFNGCGHTITVNRTINDPDGAGGLFNFVSDTATNPFAYVFIRNVRVAGVINLTNSDSTKGYVGGLIGCVDCGSRSDTFDSGLINIDNCVSSVRINASGSHTWYAISGFIGFVRHASGLAGIQLNISGCLWDGVINAGPALEYSGAFVGYVGNGANANRPLSLTITSSAITGTIMLNTAWTDDTGLITGYLKGNGSQSASSKVTAVFRDIVITGKFTASVNLTKWCSLFQLSGTTEVTLENLYYVSFNVPGKGAIPVYEYSSSDPGTVIGSATVKTTEQMAALTDDDFFSGSAWHFFNDGETAPMPIGIYNRFEV